MHTDALALHAFLNRLVLGSGWAWLHHNNFDVFQHCWNVELEQEAKRLYAPVAATFERNADRLADIRSRLHPIYHDCVKGFRGVNREFCVRFASCHSS